MNKNPKILGAGIAAFIAAAVAGMPGVGALLTRAESSPARRTRVPMMVTASPEQIEAWNEVVDARNRAKRTPRKVTHGGHRQFKRQRIAPLRALRDAQRGF
jgi:hypothetical protein